MNQLPISSRIKITASNIDIVIGNRSLIFTILQTDRNERSLILIKLTITQQCLL